MAGYYIGVGDISQSLRWAGRKAGRAHHNGLHGRVDVREILSVSSSCLPEMKYSCD